MTPMELRRLAAKGGAPGAAVGAGRPDHILCHAPGGAAAVLRLGGLLADLRPADPSARMVLAVETPGLEAARLLAAADHVVVLPAEAEQIALPPGFEPGRILSGDVMATTPPGPHPDALRLLGHRIPDVVAAVLETLPERMLCVSVPESDSAAAAAARTLARRAGPSGATCVFLGDDGARALAEAMIERLPSRLSERCVNATGCLTLRDTAAVLARAEEVVHPDEVAFVLATLLGVRTTA